MRTNTYAPAILLFLASIGQAEAKSHFVAYEGKDSVQEGRGGTKVAKNGIDYWTTGLPPHRYQILGIITDKRCIGSKLCGDPVGSPAIAEAAKAAGGNAVLFMSEVDKAMGSVGGASAYGNGHSASGFGWSAMVGDHVTTLVVVKYLPDGAVEP